MLIIILMALAMSSPIVFQGLWVRRGFRTAWWIGLAIMVMLLVGQSRAHV